MYPSQIQFAGHDFELFDATRQRYRCKVCCAETPQPLKEEHLVSVVARYASLESCRPITLEMDVDEAEARALTRFAPWGEDDWYSYYFDPRHDDPKAAEEFLLMQSQRVRFYHRGDPIAIATVIDAITPAEQLESEPESRDIGVRSLNYRLDLDLHHIVRLPFDNAGLSQHRLVDPSLSVLERAFIEEWQKENERIPGLHDSVGFLQALMDGHSPAAHKRNSYLTGRPLEPSWMSQRDRDIAATLIQWLGTNCGQGFLDQVNRRSGGLLARAVR